MVKDEAINWTAVSDMQKGFNENRLPLTDELAGRDFKFYLEKSEFVNCVFQDNKNLSWNKQSASGQDQSIKTGYEAIKITSSIYFIDFLLKGQPRTSISVVMDMDTGKALLVKARVPTLKQTDYSFLRRMNKGLDLSPMKVEVFRASLNHPFSTKKNWFEATEDLMGKRVRYTYSRQHVYEHIYLNHRFYAWHCLGGPEKGTCDVDACDYYRVDPGIYVFIWREKVVPTMGMVIVNLNDLRSNGKIIGLDVPTGKVVNFTMGAFARVISEVKN